jgi:hypothetical protein
MMKQRVSAVKGVITIKRHPLDVLLSNLNYSFSFGRGEYFRDGIPKAVERIVADGEMDYYIDAFIEAGGIPEYAARCFSYPGFYSAWRKVAADTDNLDLRYEEMASNPEASIQTISRFLQLESIDTNLVMRRVERDTRLDGKFYWRKQPFNFRQILPEQSIRRFEEGFARPLHELGYGDKPLVSGGPGALDASKHGGQRRKPVRLLRASVALLRALWQV